MRDKNSDGQEKKAHVCDAGKPAFIKGKVINA
jgi:hypothetical protein